MPHFLSIIDKEEIEVLFWVIQGQGRGNHGVQSWPKILNRTILTNLIHMT